MEVKDAISYICTRLPDSIRAPIERACLSCDSIDEITLRINRPVCVETTDGRLYVSRNGFLIDRTVDHELVTAEKKCIGETFLRLCDYSVYARQDELNQGFITIGNGIRVGICGTAVMKDGEISHIKDISTLSFRIPREVIGCSDELLKLVHPMSGVLICGAPCSGKTTLIRDMARVLSQRYRVTLIDERGELSASRGGAAGYDIGFSDVYLNMPKGEGIIRAVRSLAPHLIVCDELGGEQELESIRYAIRCGAAFIATVHAADLDDLRARPAVRNLLNAGAFRYLVFLGDRRKPGHVARIYEWSGADD